MHKGFVVKFTMVIIIDRRIFKDRHCLPVLIMRTSVIKILSGIFLLIIVALIIVYFFIPSQLNVSIVVKVNCNTNAVSRTINYKWHEVLNKENSGGVWNGYTYTVSRKMYNAAGISIKHNTIDYTSTLVFYPINNDSTAVQWSVQMQEGNNPFSKLVGYYKAQALKNNMTAVLQQLSHYLENTACVYHYNITHTTLTDTTVISTQILSNAYPSTASVYGLVQSLKQYINEQGAHATNYPMLNVRKTDSGFLVMVGIPTDRKLPARGVFYPKRLIPYENKILTTQVIGGSSSILEAYRQIELYMQDHSLEAPVIPFELMITDRSKEADTTKWVTKIFYPIV